MFQSMRKRRTASVLRSMPGYSAFLVPFALCLLLSPGPGLAEPAQALPGGSSAVFRDRMMAWSTPAPMPVSQNPPPVRIGPPSVRIPAVLPPLSSTFGYRLHPIRGTYALHSGIDIPGHAGTPILASGPGIVRFAGWAGGYGNLIEIDHGNGIETRYGHLSRILVGAGTPVSTGQQIALMGSTGMSTGSHLHFEVRRGGKATDPLPYFGQHAPAFASAFLFAARPAAGAPAATSPHISKFAQAMAAAGRIARPGS